MAGFLFDEYRAALKAATGKSQRKILLARAAEDENVSAAQLRKLRAQADRLEARR